MGSDPLLPGPQVLFLGLSGGAAAAFCRFAESCGPLPSCVDRGRVGPADVGSGSFPASALGRARWPLLLHRVARSRPEVLFPGPGPMEQWLLQPLLPTPSARTRSRAPRGLPGTPDGAPVPSWVHELAAAPDVVVRTVSTQDEEEWEVPVHPQVPSLHLVCEDSGTLRLLQACPWVRRRCRSCLLAAAHQLPGPPEAGVETLVQLAGLLARPGTGTPGRGTAEHLRQPLPALDWPDCVCNLREAAG